MKIQILGDAAKTVVLGIAPDGEIIRLIQVNELDLIRTGIDRLQLLQQPKRQVLIQ